VTVFRPSDEIVSLGDYVRQGLLGRRNANAMRQNTSKLRDCNAVMCRGTHKLNEIGEDLLMSTFSSPHFLGPSDLPYSFGIAVAGGQRLSFTCRVAPQPVNVHAPSGSRERFGDTYTQAKSVFRNMAELLAALGLAMKDVIQMRVYVVSERHADNRPDYPSGSRVYNETFNTGPNPSKPARATSSGCGLVDQDSLIEIEAIAAFPPVP
jgi:enamine deaminase RidA (YjgF/YER057c/UK114 family)